jgi:hypothetical protein
MANLAPGFQLGERRSEDRLLSGDEPFEIVRIAHGKISAAISPDAWGCQTLVHPSNLSSPAIPRNVEASGDSEKTLRTLLVLVIAAGTLAENPGLTSGPPPQTNEKVEPSAPV